MKNPLPLEALLAEARRHRPFGDPSELGFETRLRAALGELSHCTPPTLADCLARLSWRFAVASLPVALAAAAFLAITHRDALPDGMGGLVHQWSELLPLDL